VNRRPFAELRQIFVDTCGRISTRAAESRTHD
jgi:hypothetical protein